VSESDRRASAAVMIIRANGDGPGGGRGGAGLSAAISLDGGWAGDKGVRLRGCKLDWFEFKPTCDLVVGHQTALGSATGARAAAGAGPATSHTSQAVPSSCRAPSSTFRIHKPNIIHQLVACTTQSFAAPGGTGVTGRDGLRREPGPVATNASALARVEPLAQ